MASTVSAIPFHRFDALGSPVLSASPDTSASPSPGFAVTAGRFVISLPNMVWMGLDAALAWAGAAVGQALFVDWTQGAGLLGDASPAAATITLASSVVLAGLMFGLYEPHTLWHRSRIVARGLLTSCVAVLGACLVVHLLMYSTVSRQAAAAGILFHLLTATGVRLLAHEAVTRVCRRLLIVGHGPTTPGIIRAVRRGAAPGYRLAAVVNVDGSAPVIPGVETLFGADRIERLVSTKAIDEVVVAGEDEQAQKAALACLRLGCRVTDDTTFHEKLFGEVPVERIRSNWFLLADLRGHQESHAAAKRLFDLGASLIVLALSLPLWPLIMTAIWLETGGPVFYSQRRVGRRGRVFTLHKFRTMRTDAEANGSVWAAPADPRTTHVGRFLRRTRLDELPQLWNILRSDMSVVGPRPERPEFVTPLNRLIPHYDHRHLIKPGLTGWAQINFRYGASIADARRKLQLDLYYVKHMSFELDFVILLRTFGKVIAGIR